MQLGGTIIQVSCNQANQNSFVNLLSGQPPSIPVAGTVQWPCALFFGTSTVPANLVTDLGNLVTANLVVRAGNQDGAVLFEQVIPAAEFNPALTYAQWIAGSAAHFTFTMDTTDTNLPEGTVWIAIGVTATGGVDIPVTYCSNAQVKQYGIFNAAAPTAPDYTSWSKEESDARYATVAQVAAAQGVINLYNAGYLLVAQLSCDFSKPRNSMFTAVL